MGGGALATVAKSLSSRKYADIFLLGFFIFPFCSHISLVFLYFSSLRVCVWVCVARCRHFYWLTFECRRVAQKVLQLFRNFGFGIFFTRPLHSARGSAEFGFFRLFVFFFCSFLTSIKYIFHDYKWDLFAISGNISGSALPSRVCGHKNAKKLFTPLLSPFPSLLFAIRSALLHFCRINQLFSLLFSLSRRTNLSTQMAPQDNA